MDGSWWILIAYFGSAALVVLCVCCGVHRTMRERKNPFSDALGNWHEQQHEVPAQSWGRWIQRGQSELDQLSPVSLLRISPLQEEGDAQQWQVRSRPGWQERAESPAAAPEEAQWQQLRLPSAPQQRQRVDLSPEWDRHQQDQTVRSPGSGRDAPPPYREDPPPSYEEAIRQTAAKGDATAAKCDVFTVELAGVGAAAERQNWPSRTVTRTPAGTGDFWRTAPSALRY